MEEILFLDRNEKVKHKIVFNSDEEKEDKENETSFVKEKIYDDDTILNIKYKIFNECQKIDVLRKTYIQTMYLFGYVKRNIDYAYFKKNMNKNNYEKILKNYKFTDFEVEENDFFEIISYLETSYNKNKSIYQLFPIGQKIINSKLHSVNPLDFEINDTISFSRDQNNVAFEYFELYDKSIFVLDIETIVNSDIKLKDEIIKKYFIFSTVSSSDEYFLKKDTIQDDSINLKSEMEKYNIYNNNAYNYQTKLDYSTFGVNLLEIDLLKTDNSYYPIDILFKIFKTSKEIPYIKYNPSLREEKLNRFYMENKRTFLSSLQIHRLQKIMNLPSSVQMNVLFDNEEFILSFLQNGNVNIYFETANFYNLNDIKNFIVKHVNPVIKQVQTLFQQFGYYYEEFNNFDDKNVLIKNINCKYLFKFTKNRLDVPENLFKCIVPIFELKEKNEKSMKFIYKKVGSSITSDVNIDVNIDKYKGETHLFFHIENLNNIIYIDLLEKNILILSSMIKDNYQSDFEDKMCKNLSEYDYEKIEEEEKIISEKIKEKDELSEKESDEIDDDNLSLNRVDDDDDADDDVVNSTINTVVENVDDSEIVESNISEIKENITNEEEKEPEEEEEKESDKKKDVNDLTNEEKAKKVAKTTTELVDIGNDLLTNATTTIGNLMNTVSEAYDSTRKNLKEKINEESEKKKESEEKKESEISEVSDISEINEDKKESEENEESKESQDDTISSIGSSINLSESDESNKSKESLKGGAKDNDKIIRRFFQERISSRDKQLFEKYNQDNTMKNKFAKYCPSNLSRQPVILNEKEKKNIDENYPNSYNGESIHYGSSENNKNYYICPRYWCIEGNISLNPEDVYVNEKTGELESKSCVDGTIHEFTSDLQHKDKKGDYRFSYPGLLKKNGECLPCCFGKKPNNAQLKSLMNKCMTNNDEDYIRNPSQEELSAEETEILSSIKTTKKDDDKIKYVQQSNKFPLEHGKIGHIPLILKKLFNTENTDYALVHIGCNHEHNKSFISCISTLYTLTILKDKRILFSNDGLPIKIFNSKIINALNLDLFIEMHNGNLVHIFDNNSETTLNKDDHSDSEIYKKLYKTENSNNDFVFNKILNAYENFQNYILNKDTIIDHKYLWDLFCKPNPKLFPNGINIIILEVNNENDDYVEFLCPPNYYSNHKIDINKDYCFILKRNHYYEPILFYKNVVNDLNEEFQHLRVLNESVINKYELHNVKSILKYIDNLYNQNYCYANENNNYKNNFKSVYGKTIEDLLPKLDFEIIYQVVNLNAKIIGFICKVNNNKLLEQVEYTVKSFNIFIPCFPTHIRGNYDILLLNNNINNYVQNYEKTKLVLEFIYSNTNRQINLNPKNKIIDKDYVIGLVCNGNLFIPTIKKQKQSIVDELEEVNNNYLVYTGDTFVYLDEIILKNNKEDKERKQIVKKIKLENDLYNLFRNLARMVLNNYKNIKSKNEILNILNTKYYTYVYKFNKILDILKEELSKHIIFTNKMNNLEKIQNLTKCIDIKDDCNIFLPVKNLVSNKVNESIYFEKLTDEIIRFGHYRKFIFDSQYYLNSTINEYELESNEILLPQSLTNISYIDEYNNSTTNNTNYEDAKNDLYVSPTVNYEVNNTKKEKEKSVKNTTRKKECPKKCPRKTRCNKKKGICETMV